MKRPALLALVIGPVALAGCGSTASAGHGTPASPAQVSTASPAPTARGAQRTPPHLQVRAEPWRLPVPLAREAVVPIAGRHRVLVAGGLLAGDTSSASTYTLDLRSGRLARGPSLPVPVHDTAGARVGSHPLVIGGGNAAEQDVVQARGRHGWRVVSRLPTARSDLTAVRTGGRVLVLGGYDGLKPALGAILASQGGRVWARIGRLANPVRYPGVVAADGAVWVFGGERDGAEVDTVQRVDPATGRTRVVAHLPQPLGHESALWLGRRILVVGGRTDPDTPTARMWWFDPASRRFRPAGRLPHPLADSAVARGRGRAWLVGGETPRFSDRVLELALTR